MALFLVKRDSSFRVSDHVANLLMFSRRTSASDESDIVVCMSYVTTGVG